MGSLHIGRFMIKYEWIIFLISIAVVYFVLKRWLKNDQQFQQTFIDAIFNTAFIGFLTYKFSVVLFKPMMLFENPISVLYFTGGKKGGILGVILAICYLVWKTKREKWQGVVVWQGVFYTVISFVTAFWLFRTLLYIFL